MSTVFLMVGVSLLCVVGVGCVGWIDKVQSVGIASGSAKVEWLIFSGSLADWMVDVGGR